MRVCDGRLWLDHVCGSARYMGQATMTADQQQPQTLTADCVDTQPHLNLPQQLAEKAKDA